MKKYEMWAGRLLRKLGVNSSYLGFYYITRAVAMAIYNPSLLHCVSKGLYVDIAADFCTTVSCVERDIRTVVNIIWNRGDQEFLGHIFESSLTSRPSNADFIALLAQYVKEQMEE